MFSINPLMSQRSVLGSPLTPTMDFFMMDEWELSPSEIIMDRCLGEGAFGEVYKGVLKGPVQCSKVPPSMRNTVPLVVAVKLLKCKILLVIL